MSEINKQIWTTKGKISMGGQGNENPETVQQWILEKFYYKNKWM